MSQLGEKTAALKADGKKALVAFLTAGYPDENTFVETVRAAGAAGCDIIEIGIPFSDPIADGPVIQASSTVALAGGMTLFRAMDLASKLSSEVAAELVLMGYVNPILTYGITRFGEAAKRAGFGGVILPDVPLEESSGIRSALTKAGLDYIDLIAPTSSEDRVAKLAASARGFIYLVSMTGVTGAEAEVSDSLPRFVERVKDRTDTPAYVGFGISSAEQARYVTRMADGVIIGSKLIRLMDDGDASGAAERVGSFLTDVRHTIDNG